MNFYRSKTFYSNKNRKKIKYGILFSLDCLKGITNILVKLKLVNIHINAVWYSGKGLGFVGINPWNYSGFVSV